MDFDEITCVVPWDEAAGTCGWDLDADQIATPRLFKSHCTYDQIAKGARYIYVARNPSDCLVSFYHFIVPYFGYSQQDISFEDFAELFFFSGSSAHGSIFPHLLSWWKQRENPDVLWMFYEDLREDLPACVRRIADFMGINLTEELLAVTLENSSFRFMRDRAPQFDDHFVRNAAYVTLKLTDEEGFKVGKGTVLSPSRSFLSLSPPSLPVFSSLLFLSSDFILSTAVREGGGGSNYAIPENISAKLRSGWAAVMGDTGYGTFHELREDLSCLKGRREGKGEGGK